MKKKLLLAVLLFGYHFTKAQSFDVEQLPKAKKIDWSGSIGANASGYTAKGIPNRSNPFTWSLNANVNVRILEVLDLPFSLTVGKYQTQFTKPYLQFGISPRYKWATLHVGNSNLTFNPYTLSGYSFLGVGAELNPGNFRFAAMYGRLNKAVEVDTSEGNTKIPSFKRMGYGAKIGYGTADNFIDLIYFHAKDDANSISSWKDPEIQAFLGDANTLTPQENNVLGTSAKLTIKKFSFNVDAGISYYNKNVADSQFMQNKKGLNIAADRKTQYAGKTGIGYNFTNFSIRADYERVLPEYVTLGSYFFTTDIENFTFSPSGTFDSSKGSYALSLGLQKNNLDKTKTETTKRFIGSANIVYNPNAKWAFNLVYNNFSVRQVQGTEPINDSSRLRQVNQTFTFTPTYSIIKDSVATHTLSVTANYNDVNDRNIITREFTNMKATMFSFNHSSSFVKMNNAISSGLNFNRIKTAASTNTQYGASLGYTQSFFKQALSASVGANYNMSYVNAVQDGNIITANATASYQLKTRHSFSFNASLIRSNSKQFESYTELTGSLSYVLLLK
ncbi:MAG TPA: hypothetical protein VK484_05475 [Ferruginibacter sp.]|nr:hypothetical protein [Ferruginibacter sp.]